MLFTWHCAHAVVKCVPVSGKPVFEWSKVALVQFVVEWHSEQSVGKPAVTWFGFVVVLYELMWHVARAADVSL